MNKVSERCKLDKHAKFYYASNRLFFELKIIRIILYVLAIIPVVITILPQLKTNAISSLACTIVSFAITLISESTTSFMNKHKDSAVYALQLYETGVTGSPFSKIEYDRELTNELNELAIRKGIPQMKKQEEYHTISVPKDITDDHSYLYICRMNAATNKYILSRIIYIYFFLLMGIVALFIGAIFLKQETSEYLILIIGFYPLVSPIIKDCNSAKECMRDCTKICADIDNYFADGDDSLERLARMYYYVEQIEFEMYSSRPTVYKVFKAMFSTGVEILQDGVTDRFRAAIVELKQKAMISKGYLNQPKGKSLITQKEYDLAKLKQIEKEKKTSIKPVTKLEVKATSKPVVKTESKITKPVVKTAVPSKTAAKTNKTVISKSTTKTKTPVKTNSKAKATPKATTSKKK